MTISLVGIEERLDLLSRVPLFAGLARDELREIAEQLDEVRYGKGETVCEEGDPADRLFIVVRGRLDVWSGHGSLRRLVNRLGPGAHLGEIGLLLDETRTATVMASRAARLLALGREDFGKLAETNAAVMREIARGLGHQLAARTKDAQPEHTALAVGVAGTEGVQGKTLVSTSLAALLGRELGEDVLVVSAGSSADGAKELDGLMARAADALPGETERVGDRLLRLEVKFGRLNGSLADALGELVERLGNRFKTVVVDMAGDSRAGVAAAAEACDVLVEVTHSERDACAPLPPNVRGHRVLNLYDQGGPVPPINNCEPFVLPTDLELLDRDAVAQARHVVENPRAPASPPLHRLARKVLGRSVGLALGGGAAFGIAHVGVLKTLEDNGIPVDLLAGTSMGSIVALGYAAGIEPDEMLSIARRIGNKRMTLSALDFAFFTRPGLLSGARLKAIFGPLTGSVQRFQDLTYPCQTVATDIETGERVCIGDGQLTDAFRASSSVPMLWAPVRRDGRTLVDGAIIDPVPVDVVREIGADLCIAVNVVPTLDPEAETILSRASRWANSVNPFSYVTESRMMPNLFDIGMNSLQMLQFELGSFKARDADVLLNLDLSDFTWIEFYRAEELIQRGAEAMEAALPQVREALASRVA